MTVTKAKMAFKIKMRVVVHVAFAVVMLNLFRPTLTQEARTCSVLYDLNLKQLSLVEGKKQPFVAWATFKNEINQTGWGYLEVHTNASYDDHLQAHAAGMAEGYLTNDLIAMRYQNEYTDYCKGEEKFCATLEKFLDDNFKWIQKNIKSQRDSTYWHQLSLVYGQLNGLQQGYVLSSNTYKMTALSFLILQLLGDLLTLETVLGRKRLSNAKHLGHCSGLVKIFPGGLDIGISQVAWYDYNAMLRVFKLYDFKYHLTNVQGHANSELIHAPRQSFSSYPGALFSIDDFYILSSGLVTQETSIDVTNPDLYKYIVPSSVLEWARVIVANRLAKTGNEWTSIFSRHNSGTYNNQWMILDYNRFEPGKPLKSGTLWVLEQLPHAIEMADMTALLQKQTYWPSYNVAYFPYIYNMSGAQKVKAKHGNWFDYYLTARAQIFKRDHHKVEDMESLIKLMRYNDYKHDPLSKCNCTPPYSATNAISARCDLNPINGSYPFNELGHSRAGGYDCKATNYKMAKNLSSFAVSGPTWDQQPVFQWSKTEWKKPLGHPDVWNFKPIVIKWG